MTHKHERGPRARRLQQTLASAVIMVAAVAGARADTLYVNGACGDNTWTGLSPNCEAPDGPKRSIRAAITVSVSGDTIIVADGIYTGAGNRNLSFDGRNLTLRSENGAEDCIIDCEAVNLFLRVVNGVQGVLDGFTVRNGFVAGNGGALLVSGASVTINGCAFRDNRAGLRGGAIFASGGASVALVDTEVDGNQAERGGGVYISGGEVTVSGCSFTGNFTTPGLGGGGGGLRVTDNGRLICTDSSFTANISACGGAGILANTVDPTSRITGCWFMNNEAQNGCGGGGFASTSDNDFAEISNCIFKGNVAGFAGGILFRNFNTTLVENVLFLNNTAVFGGGACVEQGNSPEFRNCLFAGNSAITGGVDPPAGGAIDIFGGTPTMVNCTFSDNSSEEFGGAVTVYNDGDLGLVNCVLWGNQAPFGPEIRIGYPDFGSGTVTVSYSDVEGGEGGVSIGKGSTLIWGDGNIDDDPLFLDPINDDYHLSAGSPCIDTGDNTALPPEALADLDGRMRIWDGTVDMGCYEFGSYIFGDVNCDGTIDALDIEPFILALFDPPGYAQLYPDCDINLADLNGDGSVDALDIEPFLNLLFAP